ncbi:FGGY-family carbohydrate kinase [Thiomicrorhabdus sp. Milos-T2]|uniref:FGGY-family carbohydrate kinase n=1 Tax=Thiomicrorhabdus sp. Milos-T2 TaxID=90814 RepID=UPI0004946A08|nr:FGGY-family carbohydrate kinase [Thiomicrorhabdus sp. Milos-T2]
MIPTQKDNLPFKNSILQKQVILGLDIGTSGIRGCVVERVFDQKEMLEKILFETHIAMPAAKPEFNEQSNTVEISQDPHVWINHLEKLLKNLEQNFNSQLITHLVVDATSSTVLLVDQKGNPCTRALMYNDSQSSKPAQDIAQLITQSQEYSGAQGVSSTLAKVSTLLMKNPNLKQPIICHQIDFINHYLCGVLNITDENNALKLGYNSVNQAWPNWVMPYLNGINSQVTLPLVVKPGDFLAKIMPSISKNFGFNKELTVMAGTTDSIAGFLASGAINTGDAVTSLGSTMVIKAISNEPIFDDKYGLYSHKLGAHWLVGGASNTGGKVLLNEYDLKDLIYLIENTADSFISKYLKEENANYYPLNEKGERFPISNPELSPSMPSRPNCKKTDIYHSDSCLKQHQYYVLKILFGMTNIEKIAYQKLEEMGLPKIKRIFTVGGGTKNLAWMKLREFLIDASFTKSTHQQAAYGVTKLLEPIKQ